jgi:Zn-dependent protease with chaperone function
MNNERFEDLVSRLERRFANRPTALAWRVMGWVVVGYASFLVWLVLMVVAGLTALAAGAFSHGGEALVFLTAGAAFTAIGVLQILVLIGVRLEPPNGHRLSPADAPKLFALIDEFQTISRCRIDRVLLSSDLNACVAEIPRLGVFGWTRKYLCVGLPLLDATTPDEFRAVVAHEFAHLSAEHGRLSNWIYRLRIVWGGLFRQLHKQRQAGLIRLAQRALTAFIDWYWPRFNARAFVLCRAHEYFADRWAAAHALSGALAQALWRTECYNRRLKDEFWPALRQLANTQPEPPDDIVDQMRLGLASAPQGPDEERWVEQSHRSLTDHADTHPCFADRVRAVGLSAETFRDRGYPRLPDPSAAAALLGTAREALARAVSLDWREEVVLDWSGRNVKAGELARRLERIEKSAPQIAKQSTTLWDRARVFLERDEPANAEPILRQLLEIDPSHGGANLALGQWLLDQGQPDGVALLERVSNDEDSEWTQHACNALAEHFRSTGASEQLKSVRSRLGRYSAQMEASQKERSIVTAADRFVPHELSAAELEELLNQLKEIQESFDAWLVRKDLKHFRKRRLFVLCVRTPVNWFGLSSAQRDAALSTRIVQRIRLPGQMLAISPQGSFKRLARKVMAARGARIFPVSDAGQQTV